MRWAVFLRAVNVGGTGKLQMAALRTALEDAGATEVATYVQSGNVVLTEDIGDPRAVERKIGGLIEARFGFRPGVMAFDAARLDTALAEAPWGDDVEGRFAHLAFFIDTPDPDAENRLARFCTQDEEVRLGSHCLFIHYPNGSGRSKLSGQIEKALGCPATARNLNTVRKVREML